MSEDGKQGTPGPDDYRNLGKDEDTEGHRNLGKTDEPGPEAKKRVPLRDDELDVEGHKKFTDDDEDVEGHKK